MGRGRPAHKRVSSDLLTKLIQSQHLSYNKTARLMGINRQTVMNWLRLGIPEQYVDKLKFLEADKTKGVPTSHPLIGLVE